MNATETDREADPQGAAVADPTAGDVAAPRPTPQTTRKPGVTGYPFALADGQTWTLAGPSVRYLPRIVAAQPARPESVELACVVDYPLSIKAKTERLSESIRDDPENVRLAFLFDLAAALLMAAHELTPAQACGLLSIEQARLDELVVAVFSAVTGRTGDTDDRAGDRAVNRGDRPADVIGS